MRLAHSQTRLIADRVRRYLGAQAKIWLFGSRVDDRQQRVGDVDLDVETDHPELLLEPSCKISQEESLELLFA